MQQFTIQSEKIRDKLNSLLPSQNVGGIGVELTGSTQVIPIVDLTEIAEGSGLRQDLQTAFNLIGVTSTNISNTTTDLVNTTGFYRVFGTNTQNGNSGARIEITDGATTKILFASGGDGNSNFCQSFEFIVKITAGDTLRAVSSGSTSALRVITQQIADISGNLT